MVFASASAVAATTRNEQSILEKFRTIYQEVCEEFYAWEKEYYTDKLSSLGPPTATRGVDIEIESDDDLFSFPHSSSVEANSFRLTVFSSNADPVTETVSCPTYVFPTIEAGKPYEACTYSHKNIYIADDMCEKLPFVPFADNAQFPLYDYMNVYDGVGWETQKDPDLEVIAAEAARRLHFRHNLSFEEIDQSGILSVPIMESHGRKGLLQIFNQRDLLRWSGSESTDPPLPRSEGPPPTDLKKRINGICYLFCANLNCVEPYCPTHLNMAEITYPSDDCIYGDTETQHGPSCGTECFKHLEHHKESLLCWDSVTLEDFKFIYQSASELSSCDLAILCDKPCREVYTYRRHCFPRPNENATSSLNISETESGSSDSGRERLVFADTVRGSKLSVTLPPSDICQHTGKCDGLTDCRCYRKKLHCHRNCSCDLSCARRPKGCHCKNSGRKMCRTIKCPCYRAGRECDPELCKKCGAKGSIQEGMVSKADICGIDASVTNRCRNNDLQHGRTKAIEVKEGAYGLGLFLVEPAKEGDLVGEYVGEILSDRMTEARGFLSRHLGRNYLFALNVEWTIDASLAGNETRFINHASGNLANCRAEVREVNGDHRIGIYVVKKQLDPGEEIFMDYGEEYFMSGNNSNKTVGRKQ